MADKRCVRCTCQPCTGRAACQVKVYCHLTPVRALCPSVPAAPPVPPAPSGSGRRSSQQATPWCAPGVCPLKTAPQQNKAKRAARWPRWQAAGRQGHRVREREPRRASPGGCDAVTVLLLCRAVLWCALDAHIKLMQNKKRLAWLAKRFDVTEPLPSLPLPRTYTHGFSLAGNECQYVAQFPTVRSSLGLGTSSRARTRAA